MDAEPSTLDTIQQLIGLLGKSGARKLKPRTGRTSEPQSFVMYTDSVQYVSQAGMWLI